MHLPTVLCGLFFLSAGVQLTTIKQEMGLKSAAVGENVTLRCVCESQVAMHFSWYRQFLGSGPQLLSTFYKFENPSEDLLQLEDPRFSVERKDGVNNLQISDVRPSDSAMYYCASSHSNMVEFGVGVLLSVEGTDHVKIIQEPSSESIQPGESVTFSCTVHTGSCSGETSVYWFRHGSRLGALLSYSNQCKPYWSPPSLSCVFHFENTSRSDAGVYYCAVASCGEILFGRGTKLQVGGDVEEQMRTLVHLAVFRTGTVLLLLTVCLLVFCYKNR